MRKAQWPLPSARHYYLTLCFTPLAWLPCSIQNLPPHRGHYYFTLCLYNHSLDCLVVFIASLPIEKHYYLTTLAWLSCSIHSPRHVPHPQMTLFHDLLCVYPPSPDCLVVFIAPNLHRTLLSYSVSPPLAWLHRSIHSPHPVPHPHMRLFMTYFVSTH